MTIREELLEALDPFRAVDEMLGTNPPDQKLATFWRTWLEWMMYGGKMSYNPDPLREWPGVGEFVRILDDC